jgi:hypothetical protein
MSGCLGKKNLGGRPRRLSRDEESYIIKIMHDNNVLRLEATAHLFVQEFHDNQCDKVGSYLLSRLLTRPGWSKKKIRRKNLRADPQEQLEYLDRIAHIGPFDLVDIDGMAQSPDDFHDKYGWAPVGEDAIRMEIEIGNRIFAVHAA